MHDSFPSRPRDALAEVAAWSHRPENEEEFLIVYIDTAYDHLRPELEDRLMRLLQDQLGAESMFTYRWCIRSCPPRTSVYGRDETSCLAATSCA